MRLRPLALAVVPCVALSGACGGDPEVPQAPPDPLFDVGYSSASALETDWHRVSSVCVVGDAPAGAAERVAEQARRAGLPVVDGCAWRIEFATAPLALDAEAQAAWNGAARDEAHEIVTRVVHGVVTSTIYAPTRARYAVDNLFAATAPSARKPNAQLVPLQTIVDWPSIPVRGVVEGFYGLPFDAGGRTALLYEMAEARQNTYVYGPQNDDEAHIDWFQPYEEEELAELAESAAIADDLGIDFAWTMRPGQGVFYVSTRPIVYSSDADFQLLTAKLTQVRSIGVHVFGLFFDDNVPSLSDPADLAAYGSLAAAQVSLVNRVDDWLQATDPTSVLWFVGTDYSASTNGWQTYDEALRSALHPSVRVLWTGNQTYSPTIVASDLTDVTASLGRKPVIWDNWPTTITALSGRSADLSTGVAGFLSNPVICSWEAGPATSFIDVAGTAGMYAWRTSTYDPATAIGRWRDVRPAL